MSEIPSFTFNNGIKIPSIGMGCWMGTPGGGEKVYEMCVKALKVGYRHFDTACGYANEQEVGRAIRDSGIPRSEVFITTKLPNQHDKVKEFFEESLKLLDCEYIDLYLIHWPQTVKIKADGSRITLKSDESPTIVETWKEMEKLLETGKVKTIGVSNFGIRLLDDILANCTVVPATNQVESHPCLPQNELLDYCKEKNILITAYSPLGRGPTLMSDTTINSVAEELRASPAQVVLSWGVQRGVIVIPKSENEDRMTANLTLVTLSPEQMENISTLHKQPGMHKSLLAYHKPDNTVFGWTYEQLGWNMTTDGIVPN